MKSDDARLPARPVPTAFTTFKTFTPRSRVVAASLLAACTLFPSLLFSASLLPLSRLPWETAHTADVLPNEANWDSIPSSTTLDWHRCHGRYDCARLDVPMDWAAPDDGRRVVLAVIRLNATDRDGDNYKGPLLFNPGGPGGSGVFSMLDHGALLQSVAGQGYDIVTLDPRGIGASTPRLDCWTSRQNYHFWQLQDVGVVDAHPGALPAAYARMAAYADLCEDGSPLLAHASTASHAHDLLAVLDALGERTMQYWGFSYGTLLGGTFAAMFPDRVGRLVSDGNVDYREWYAKTHLNFLRDTDRVMDAFFDLCHRAGAACAMHDDTPDRIAERVAALATRLQTHPVVVTADRVRGPELPELVTYSRLRRLVSAALYQPQRVFAPFARILRALELGDGRPFYEWHAALSGGASLQSAVCDAESTPRGEPLRDSVEGNDDAFPAIMCTDSVPLQQDTLAKFHGLVDAYADMSRWAGATNVLFPIHCVNRHVRAPLRFTGFDAPSAPPTNTSFPILYVNNMADNITPLVSARNNSAAFAGSVVLVQQAYGHTSLAAPSLCTAKAIRAYLQDGVLPAAGTQCPPDELPFGLDVPGVDAARALSADDAELAASMRALSERVGQQQLRRMRL